MAQVRHLNGDTVVALTQLDKVAKALTQLVMLLVVNKPHPKAQVAQAETLV
jgi:hypothetical protein